jgi:NAD+ synthase
MLEKNIEAISNWIYDYAKINNIDTLIVGISGGIDSALVSTICCITGINTLVVSLPIHQKEDQLSRARKHASWLIERYANARFIEKDLSEIFGKFKEAFTNSEKSDLSLANSRSRIRMTALYQLASTSRGIVVGTGNKIEDFGVGFFTKYGDGGVDISPIGDLTKTQVRKFSSELGIISEILEAAPTDGLWEEDRTDEDQIGATYEELEWAMDFKGDILAESDRNKEVYSIYNRLNKINKHKMIEIPVFKISDVK